MVKIVCFILRDFQHNKRKLFFKKNPGQSSLWTLLQKQLAPSQHTNTAYFTIKKVFHVHRLSAPQSSSAIPHCDSCSGEQYSKLPTPSLLPHKCSGWEENQIQISGKHQYLAKFTWQEEEETKAISYTLHLSSLGQTNTQYIIRSPPTKR